MTSLRRRRVKTVIEKDTSHVEDMKTYLSNHKEMLEEAQLILDRETIDDVFFLNDMLKATDNMIKRLDE